jgi:glutamate synthase (ferredoxin)
VVAFALGVDMVNVAREAMLAVGCVQAQKCHTGDCPTGVATQNPWLAHGLDPADKSERVTNYVKTLRRDLLKVSESCGVPHPALIGPESVEVLDTLSDGRLLDEIYRYEPDWGFPSAHDQREITAIMSAVDEAESHTEGPPETSQDGEHSDDAAGERPPM